MTNPVDLIKEEIATIKEQLDIDIKKVSLLQQEIKDFQQQAQKAINATQPILENQGALKKSKEYLQKLEGKIDITTDK